MLEDLASLLTGYVTLKTDLWLNEMPKPNGVTVMSVIREYGSMAPDLGFDGPLMEHRRVQILTRARSYNDGETRAWALYNVLSAIVNQVVGGKQYYAINPLQTPFYMGADENGLALFAFNLEVQKEPS